MAKFNDGVSDTFDQDLVTAIDTVSFTISLIISLTMIILYLSELWPLMIGELNDILMTQTRSPSIFHLNDASILGSAIKF